MNIKISNKIFENIQLIVLDVVGTLIDSKELWLKEIGYIAQSVAEKHSSFQGQFFRTRAMAMKALGVDPETAELDFSGAYFLCNEPELQASIATVLYINGVKWNTAVDSVENICANMHDEFDLTTYTKPFPDVLNFLNSVKSKTKLVAYSKKSYEDPTKMLNYNRLDQYFHKIYSAYSLPPKLIKQNELLLLATICTETGIDPAKTLLIADSLDDFNLSEDTPVNRLLINRNSLDLQSYQKYGITSVINTLREIQIQ